MLNIIIKEENQTFGGCSVFFIGLEDEVAFKPLKKRENPRNVLFWKTLCYSHDELR